MKKMLLLTPLLAVILWFICDYCFVELGLIANGYPFARIVPKQQIGHHIFDYVATDCFQAEALVFSNDKAVGWIYHGMTGTVQYVPFNGTRRFDPPVHWEMIRISWLFFAVSVLLIEIIYLFAITIARKLQRRVTIHRSKLEALNK